VVLGLGRLAHSVERRVRTGPREVVWSPQSGLGFGNMLYAYLYAGTRRAEGHDCRVLTAPVMHAWLPAFPELRRLTIERDEVQWRDRREWQWRDHFGDDFDRATLADFVGQYLTGAETPEVDPERVVVNVRRGDYYDQPHFRGTYSFDIASYVEIALARMASRGPIPEVAFVSDGLDWCRLKLDAPARRFAREVTYLDADPSTSFETVAGARRIVGTNSTFSYWAGYVSSVRQDHQGHVVMPRFHARLGDDWSAYQLDPGWDVVDDIPGGWNA
jgi:hypothetical protein